MNERRVMIVAGEASGDLHGGNLVRAMRRIDPDLSFYGVGGKKMQTAGVELLADAADMAVVGLTEVFARLPFILKVMRQLKNSFREVKPDAVILVDYPDFNLIIGTEAIFMGAFDAGATGMVCGMGNVFPEVLETMYKMYLAGDRAKAMETQRLILRVRDLTKLGPTVPIMHAILQMRGIDGGYSRSPLIEIDEATKNKVEQGLKELKFLD